jgi:hypothetical protein
MSDFMQSMATLEIVKKCSELRENSEDFRKKLIYFLF